MGQGLIMRTGGGGGGSTDLSAVTAGAGDVLAGKVIVGQDGNTVTGIMVNQGAKKSSLRAGSKYAIQKGFHNGSGIITAVSLESQTPATAKPDDILFGKTAWVDGEKLEGNMLGYRRSNEGIEGTGPIYIGDMLTTGNIFIEFTDSFWNKSFGFILSQQNGGFFDDEYSIYKNGQEVVKIRVVTSSYIPSNIIVITPNSDNTLDPITSAVTYEMTSI